MKQAVPLVETWLEDVLKQAVAAQSTSVELTRSPEGLIGRINVSGLGLHTHADGLEEGKIPELLDYLQKQTGCLRHITLEVDRGYGRMVKVVNGKTLFIDIFVHGTNRERLIDLTIRYPTTPSSYPPRA